MSTNAAVQLPPPSFRRLPRERLLSLIAGALGALMFAWGFLRWLEVGDGASQRRFSGYAFETPTAAVIGFSLAAGLIALLSATDPRASRGVSDALPTALSATSLLLAGAIFLGKGSISPTLGSEVGVEVGLILALSTALLQTIVLGLNMVGRRGHNEVDAVADSPKSTGPRTTTSADPVTVRPYDDLS